MRVAVVGAGGFVGLRLVERLQADGHSVLPIVRTPRGLAGEQPVADIGTADWPQLLAGVDVVVHLAARVHMMDDRSADPLAEFRKVNTIGTMAVAHAAARAGVKRFVFISSIKVNGEATPHGAPFKADDSPQPSDPYGVSKAEAETALFDLAATVPMEVTVIRPPLVYGPGVGGNFALMIKWLRRGVPLPLGGISGNRRSLVGIDNLVDLITVALTHPGAANDIFLVSDGCDVSTRTLLTKLASALGKQARLLPIPQAVILGLARAARKEAAATRLIGNLQVDIEKTRQLLNWSPPVSMDEALKRTVAALPKV